MPTYEYRCKSCGYEFEEFQSITADPLLICPKCAEPSLKRLMSSGAGLLFKGSGFYLTDYKKSNISPQTQRKSDEMKPDAKKEAKKEAKPEPKPVPKSSKDSSPDSDKK